MTSSTRTSSKFRRYAASVVATAAVAAAGVACGTQTADDLEPAAPAQVKVHQPAQPNLAKERHEALKRHYLPPADSVKAAERYIDKEQELAEQQAPADSLKAAERSVEKAQQGPVHGVMGRPGPGF